MVRYLILNHFRNIAEFTEKIYQKTLNNAKLRSFSDKGDTIKHF